MGTCIGTLYQRELLRDVSTRELKSQTRVCPARCWGSGQLAPILSPKAGLLALPIVCRQWVMLVGSLLHLPVGFGVRAASYFSPLLCCQLPSRLEVPSPGL